MTKILTGRVAGKNHYSDLDSICATNSLVTGMTRSGKSYKLRTMAESLCGALPVWIIDPEDEFYSLREKFPFLLFGEGGELPLSVETARVMARWLLQRGVSAILSLSALKEDEQHEWVYQFVDELMSQPRAMWKRVAIILDEAHLWAPNSGHGKSEAVLASRNLARRGLKRGLIPIWATQRLASLSVAVSSSAENMMVGRTTRSADQEQAAKLLGVGKDDKAALAARLRKCKRGTFFAVGPAYGEDIITLETLPAKTTHFSGKIGQEPEKPALPKKLHYLKPELDSLRADIGAIDLNKEETPEEELARLRVYVEEKEGGHAPAITSEQLETLQTALQLEKDERAKLQQRNVALSTGIGTLHARVTSLEASIVDVASGIAPKLDALRSEAAEINKSSLACLAESADGDPSAAYVMGGAMNDSPADISLTARERRILSGLRDLEAMGIAQPGRIHAAQFAGLSANSGQFWGECGKLRRRGFLESLPRNHIALTGKGRVLIPAPMKPLTQSDLLARLSSSLGPEAGNLLDILAERKGLWMDLDDLRERARFGASSDKFRKLITKLRANEVAEYRQEDRQIRLAPRVLIKQQEQANAA